ncbi:hypothetical protein GCM10019016_115640 [Streptomyces prasinosporus]|uniref:Uncharacterized protein n=1 Tax=Streptomyces prasinosporus TaxID=68256 RepID=A0ABP6UDA6_9ACTN|nr:hypothetical protein GCM10010332_27620 [Streptomyces albogriseolus]
MVRQFARSDRRSSAAQEESSGRAAGAPRGRAVHHVRRGGRPRTGGAAAPSPSARSRTRVPACRLSPPEFSRFRSVRISGIQRNAVATVFPGAVLKSLRTGKGILSASDRRHVRVLSIRHPLREVRA